MILFIFSILVYFVISISKVKYLLKLLPQKQSFFKFNPVTIYFWIKLPIDIFKIIIGPFFILKNIDDYHYVGLAVLLASLSEILDLFMYLILSSLSKKLILNLNFKEYQLKNINYNFLSFFFFFLFIINFYLLASKEFGVLNWLLNPRQGYQLFRMGAGQYWVLSVSFLSLSFSLIMLSHMSFFKRTFLFILFSYFAFLLGSKGMLIEYLVFFMLILWLFKDKHFNQLIFIGGPVVIFGLLYNFYTTVSQFNIDSLASYFTYFTNSGMYLKEYCNNQINLFYGKIFLSDLWALVPRSIYPNKPFSYGIVLINEYFFPGAAEQTNTPAFGGPIAYFADFGILGVVLFTLFNPISIVRIVLHIKLLINFDIKFILNNNLFFLLFILFYSPYLFILIPFPLNLFLILFVFFIFVFYSLFYKKYLNGLYF